MKDIFSDLYDKVLSFFTSTQTDQTKSIAKSRLKTVLMQDRVGFSERAMQMLKDDMLDTISKYLEINVDSFSLSIDATQDATILNFSIPVLRPKTDEEIDEAIELSHQKKIEKTEEIVGELKELVKEKAQELAQNMTDNTEQIEDSDEIKEDESPADAKEAGQADENTPHKEENEPQKEEDIIQNNSSTRKKSKNTTK